MRVTSLPDLLQFLQYEYSQFLNLSPEDQVIQLEYNEGVENSLVKSEEEKVSAPNCLREWYLELGFLDGLISKNPRIALDMHPVKSGLLASITAREKLGITITPSPVVLDLLLHQSETFKKNLLVLLPENVDHEKFQAAVEPLDVNAPDFIATVVRVYTEKTKAQLRERSHFFALVNLLEYIMLYLIESKIEQ